MKTVLYCFFISNNTKKDYIHVCKNKQTNKKKRKKGEKDSFYKFKIKAGKIFSYF